MADDAWFNEVHWIPSCEKVIPSYSFYICANFDQKKDNDDQKVQVNDEIKRDIWKYLVSSDGEDDVWYYYVYNISSCAKLIPSYSYYMREFFPKKWENDNQKVQVTDV